MENKHRQDSDRAQTIDVGAIFGGGAHELSSVQPPPTISPTWLSVTSVTSVLSIALRFFFLRASVSPW